MRIAVLGATGYIGHNLIKKLLDESRHQIVAIAPNIDRLGIDDVRVQKINGDVFDTPSLQESLTDCDVAYYLIHMMAQHKLDFAKAEAMAAESFAKAAQVAAVKRIIYLGGLGDDADKLSKHLASRHKTGEIMRMAHPLVLEFRASMVIGKGSISYDIIANLVHKLPVLTLPTWSKTMTQPIGLNDALEYLTQAAEVSLTKHEIVEIGGPEVISYKELMQRYAAWKKTKAVFIDMPVIPLSIAAWWLNLFTPRRHAKVGRAMVESLANPMIVTNDRAKELFPDVQPKTLEEVFV
jgi:uncharacterized protein YbjT (DUF2867 family)